MYGSKIVALLLASAFLVTGHGGGMHYTIDGVVHPGYELKAALFPS
jgi:hypothetical protein